MQQIHAATIACLLPELQAKELEIELDDEVIATIGLVTQVSILWFISIRLCASVDSDSQ